MMKKLIYNFILVTILVLSTNVAHAADKELVPFSGDKLVVAQCAAKGNLEFIAFLQSMTFADGVINSTIEPFNDFLFRNQCQGNDESNLINQRDKVKNYIRDAFLTCNTEKLPQLKSALYKLSAEIYYVRNVVDGKVVVNLPAEVLTTRSLEDEDSLYTPSKTIKSEIQSRYFDPGYIKSSELDNFFNKLENKYSDRKKTYIKCENSSWATVEKRWKQFLDNAAGAKPALKNAEKAIGGRKEKLVEAITDIGLESYFKGLVSVNVNNLGSKSGVAQILSDLKTKYTPSSQVVTQSDLLNALSSSESNYDLNVMRANLKSTFEVLYKVGSDGANISFTEELERVNKALSDNLKPLSDLKGCAATINSKQCPISK